MTTALDEGRVADALPRISARPPEPAARLSAELAVPFRAGRSGHVGRDAGRRVAGCARGGRRVPVRRTVKPAGLPADPTKPCWLLLAKHPGMVPELARLLGIPIPPPPGPAVGPGRSSSGRRSA